MNTSNSGNQRPLVLIILDGFGINPNSDHNAVLLAKTPTLDGVLKKYPHTELDASEHQVGLPDGFMGNSEVGHLNIGAGRVVRQDFSQISHAIESGTFFTNKAFTDLLEALKGKKKPGALHLMGLISDGGVHSHISHVLALVQLAKRSGIEKVWIHDFTDGRDTSPTSGIEFTRRVQSYCDDAGVGKIATVMGRFYAMDRDNRWERTEAAYRAIVTPKSAPEFTDAAQYIQQSYDQNVTDEFIVPGVAKGYPGVQDGDGVLFFNFRADRARQLTRAFTQTDFNQFNREKLPTLAGYVTMTRYDESFSAPVAFEKPKIANTLGELVAKHGGKQLRIAETEKYAHVTYFFNGGDEKVFDGEKRVLVPSPRDVKTYDLKPEMSALPLTDQLLGELKSGGYQLVVCNFANCDMVGHTGNLRAAIQAVETVDGCLGRILDWVESKNAIAIITADHGNCEQMQAPDGTPLTSHTMLPVPFILVDHQHKTAKLAKGRLCDIAPTILALWGMKQPADMTGVSLLEE